MGKEKGGGREEGEEWGEDFMYKGGGDYCKRVFRDENKVS